MTPYLRRALRRLVNFFRWSAVDRDLRDEVEAHLAMAEAEYRRQGLSRDAARRMALHEFGGERWLEASRNTRGIAWLQDLARDTRHALQTFRRSRGFAFAVIVVMALGVGATTAVYSVIRAVLLSPLPYADPESLHSLYEGNSAGSLRLLSYPTFREVAEAAETHADLAYVRGENLIVRKTDGTLNFLGAFVTPNFFELMGRNALAGRTFGAGDDATPVVVLSSRIASLVFGDARSALGQRLSTANGVLTVIGVMPPGFAYPAWADVWLPLEALPSASAFALAQRDLHVDSDAIVRRHRGTTLDQLAALLSVPIAHASAAYREPGGHYDRAILEPLGEGVSSPSPRSYGLLFAAVTLVLVLASINIAGLVLARNMARRDELVARVVLGAGRGRLIRQLMTESTVLGVFGGATGVLLSYGAIVQLKRSAPQLVPRLEEVTLDGGVLIFALGITLLAVLVSGAVAAFRATSGVAAEAMRVATRSATSDRAAVRLRSSLVVAQIALAVVLLVSASLLARTIRELARLDLGFEPSGLVALRIDPPEPYGDDDARLLLYERLRAALERVRGVERAALANHIPLTQMWVPTAVQTEREVGPDDNTIAVFRAVSMDYLTTIGATPAQGRLFTDDDIRTTGVIVNETLARREWGDADPVGRRITVFRSAQGADGFGDPLPSYVVGVVRDLRELGPDQDPRPTVYVPLERNVWPRIIVVVKTTGPLETIIPAMRAAVHDVDPDIPTAGPHPWNEFRPLDTYFAENMQSRRFATALLTAFAAAALVLSLTGLFAVLAFMVAQRTHEIGLRMALGARRKDAAGLVLRQSALLVCLGLAIGLVATYPATRMLEASLFGLQRLDLASYVISCGIFLATAALAVYLPARRAAKIDPMIALRAD